VGYVVAFLAGALSGTFAVILWALIAAGKRNDELASEQRSLHRAARAGPTPAERVIAGWLPA